MASVPAMLPDEMIDRLHELLEPDSLLTDPADCWPYGGDNSRLHAPPGAVALPRTHEQVLELVRLCNAFTVPLLARGRGTCTTGAATPPRGALVISFERMDRIIAIDADNRTAVVEPGVTNQALQQAAGALGFFWPPDPTSAAVSTVGGNLACNAAGPRAVKYGTPRENTLALRAVTGGGEEIRTGAGTTKGVVGYDLTRLLIGSEGTLALITEATLRLTPLPAEKRTLRAFYRDIDAAARAVARVMAQPATPCAVEFIDGRAIDMIRRYSDVPLPATAGALLMIETDGSAAAIDVDTQAVADAAGGEGCLELRIAQSAQEVSDLWKTRKALSPALRTVAPKKINEDVVVPVARIPALLQSLDALARTHDIVIVNFGHAGNGNIHVNLLIDPDDPRQSAQAERCLDALFDRVLALGGTLSGEHGIGSVKREYVRKEIDSVSIRLMHDIKAQFDPNQLLNPGKKLPAI